MDGYPVPGIIQHPRGFIIATRPTAECHNVPPRGLNNPRYRIFIWNKAIIILRLPFKLKCAMGQFFMYDMANNYQGIWLSYIIAPSELQKYIC